MEASLKIITPGAYTTVQDLGRVGYLRIGIPPSGALDPVSLRLANHLVGNTADTAGLEIIYIGPEFIVQTESVRIGVVGSGSYIDILEPEKKRIPEGQSVTLTRGSRCRIMISKGSASAYLAVAGGFNLPATMDSLSTYVRGNFGGLQGRPLKADDNLPLTFTEASADEDQHYKTLPNTLPDKDPVIRVVLGPQNDHFTEAGIHTLLSESYEFSKSSDRMGARLEGPSLEVKDFEGFISDGITAGAVQVPGSGQPIVLLADHQTSGGYPKIATVISADLPIFGRIKPGIKIRFQAVSVEEAEKIRHSLERAIRSAVKNLSSVTNPDLVDVDQLYSTNIISGIVDANSDNA